MPFYEYQCRECGHNFTEQRPFENSSMEPCPQCGGVSYKKLGAKIRGLSTRHRKFSYNFNTPDPYNETLDAARKFEESGKMTDADKRNLSLRLAGLKAKKEMGLQKQIDYGDVGHPLERTDD